MTTRGFLHLAALLLFAAFPRTAAADDIPVLVYSVEPFFEFDENDEPAGFEYEILKAFADEHGHRLQWVRVPHFDGIFDRLEQGEGRLIASTVTRTVERSERFDFSAPYFPVLSLLVQRRGTEVERLEDLAGRKVLVVGGSMSAKKLQGVADVELLIDTKADSIFERAQAGETDALGTDSSNFVWRSEAYPDFVPSLPLTERSFFGFVLRKGDPLKYELDATLRRLKKSGEFRELLRKSFGKFGLETIDEMSDGLLDP